MGLVIPEALGSPPAAGACPIMIPPLAGEQCALVGLVCRLQCPACLHVPLQQQACFDMSIWPLLGCSCSPKLALGVPHLLVQVPAQDQASSQAFD